MKERERRFVEAYMANGGNGTQAALSAGYSPNGARVTANRLLTRANIQQAIADRVKSSPDVATREDRQRFWTKVMLDPSEHISARLKATELLGRSQCDFVERVEHTGQDGGPIQLEAVRQLETVAPETLRQVIGLLEE